MDSEEKQHQTSGTGPVTGEETQGLHTSGAEPSASPSDSTANEEPAATPVDGVVSSSPVEERPIQVEAHADPAATPGLSDSISATAQHDHGAESPPVETISPEGESTPVDEPTPAGEPTPVGATTGGSPPSTAAAEDSQRGANWNRVWVVLGVLALVIVCLYLANRLHATTNSAASSTATLPALAATPTATVPPATPVIKGGDVAAVVNGHKIPTSTYRTLLNYVTLSAGSGPPGTSSKVVAKQALDQVIGNEVVAQYAAAHHITVPVSEENKQITQFKSFYGGNKGFQQWLTTHGLTFASFKSLLFPDILRQKVLQRVITVPAAHVRHILVAVQLPNQPAKRTDKAAHAKATQLLQQILHGANFATLARKNSDDTSSAVKGGDLGTVYPHEMVTEFDHAAFTLALHHPVIVHTQFGYHIIEVLSRVKPAPKPVSSTEQQALQQAQQADFSVWLTNQVKHASIKRLVTVS